MPQINSEVALLTTLMRREQWQPDQPFDIYPYISRCTLDIIAEMALGSPVNAQTLAGHKYAKAIETIFELAPNPICSSWWKTTWIYRVLSRREKRWRNSVKFIKNVTEETIKQRASDYAEFRNSIDNSDELELQKIYDVKRKLGLLDLLIIQMTEKLTTIDEKGIQEEVDSFIFAGLLVASVASWTIYNVGRFIHVQDQLHEELDRVLGRRTHDVISSEQIMQMKYLDCCINETMRLFPPIPFYPRFLKKDIKLGGFDIPAGTTLAVSPYAIHNDPDSFPKPEQFDPQRFLVSTERHPCSFIPFSFGPRDCIGKHFAMMELKVIIAHVVHRFNVLSDFDDSDDLKTTDNFILRPAKGHRVSLEKRFAEEWRTMSYI